MQSGFYYSFPEGAREVVIETISGNLYRQVLIYLKIGFYDKLT